MSLSQQPVPWQVVLHWKSPTGTESVQILAFDHYEDARQEIARHAPLLGLVVGGRFLKSIELAGNPQQLYDRLT